MKSWLEAIWAQAYRRDMLIPLDRYLHGNLVLGLFSLVVIAAGSRHPDRVNSVVHALVVSTALTHVGGFAAAKVVPRMLRTIVFVQASTLFVTTMSLVVMALWLTLASESMSDVRYLPGLVLALLTYAGLELEFTGPSWLRWIRMRRPGILLGAISEVLIAACIVWRLAHG